jgi:hypothetical protein
LVCPAINVTVCGDTVIEETVGADGGVELEPPPPPQPQREPRRDNIDKMKADFFMDVVSSFLFVCFEQQLMVGTC